MLTLFAAGCTDVARMQVHYQRGDDSWVNERSVAGCMGGDGKCAGLNLIKGTACYRLAGRYGPEQMAAPKVKDHYLCAAEHLQTGLAGKPDWAQLPPDITPADSYRRLVDSLHALRDQLHGPAFDNANSQLLTTLAEWRAVDPGNVLAVLYEIDARYRQLHSRQVRSPTPPGGLCNAYRHLNRTAEAVIRRNDASRHPYIAARLRDNISLAMANLDNCGPRYATSSR